MGSRSVLGHAEPAGHAKHVVALAKEYSPAPQAATPVPSRLGHSLPAGQLVQRCALASAYVPVVQATGAAAGSRQELPAGQGRHDVCPVLS